MTTWPWKEGILGIGNMAGWTIEGKNLDASPALDARGPGKPPLSAMAKHSLMRFVILGLVLCGSVGCEAASAEPVGVQYREGTVHGFLVLKDSNDSVLTYGDQLQTVVDATVTSKTVFHFLDGSVFEEQVIFTQDDVLRMRRYSLVVRGPAFAKDWQISLDANAGTYSIETRERNQSDVKKLQGNIKLPDDVYNGMISTVARNVMKQPSTRVHIVAFTPSPRVIELDLTMSDVEPVMLGDTPRPAMRFLVKPKLGALLGIAATLAGKAPPDNHLWTVTDDVPGFIRADAAMVPDGPQWRIELAVPRWPKTQPTTMPHP